MAYSRKIWQPKCGCGCGKNATVQVFNHRNSLYGQFCATHAALILKKLKADEAREPVISVEELIHPRLSMRKVRGGYN